MADSDADGLTDAEELLLVGSSPINVNTDGDGLDGDDGFEVLDAGTNPLVGCGSGCGGP